jgi:2-polyprenyl-3-methyl-5-hydroxy-6-metoxy-1,4-benzoquinol methylase
MIDRVRTVWNAKAAEWARLSRNPRTYWNRRLRAIASLAVQHAGSGRALDVGCGPGTLCRMLAEAGFEAHGTDISENMIREAETLLAQLGPQAAARLHLCPKEGLPDFPDGNNFRIATAIGVLEYVEDRKAFIRGLAEIVEPGGYLILSNSENKSLFVVLCIASHVLRLHLTRKWFRDFGNLARTGIWTGGFVDLSTADDAYSAAALDRIAAEAGLEIVDGLDFFGVPGFDRNPLERGPLGRRLARRWGWNHMGVYRKPAEGPKVERAGPPE